MRLIATTAIALMGWCSSRLRKTRLRELLFTNVNVFDGVSAERIEKANVLVEGNLIESISTNPIDVEGATVIDGGGRTLMPGLSDTHTHLAYSSISQMRMLTDHAAYGYIRATVDAEGMLMRGITSVRDMGGNVFGLKTAIDEGLIPGPRIYPAGALIGQTAGHFDFRFGNQNPVQYGGTTTDWERQGHAYIADGADQVLTAAPRKSETRCIAYQTGDRRRIRVACGPSFGQSIHL